MQSYAKTAKVAQLCCSKRHALFLRWNNPKWLRVLVRLQLVDFEFWFQCVMYRKFQLSCASPFAKTLLPFFLREARWQLENSPKKHTSEIKRSSSWFFPHELAHHQDKPRRVTATCGQAVAGGPRLALAQREAQVAWSVTFVMFFLIMQTASELSLWQKHVSLWQEIVAISNESNHEIHFGCKCWMFGNHAVCGLAPSSKSKESPKHFALQRLTGHIAMATLRLLAATDACGILALTVSPDMRDEFWHLLRMWGVFGHRLPPAYLAVKTSSGPNSFELRTNHRITYCSSGNCQETALQAAVAMTLHDIPGSWGTFLALRLLDPRDSYGPSLLLLACIYSCVQHAPIGLHKSLVLSLSSATFVTCGVVPRCIAEGSSSVGLQMV